MNLSSFQRLIQERNNRCAAKLQAIARMFVRRRKYLRTMYKIKTVRAAVLFQKAFRGFIVREKRRRWLQQVTQPTIKIQRWYRILR